MRARERFELAGTHAGARLGNAGLGWPQRAQAAPQADLAPEARHASPVRSGRLGTLLRRLWIPPRFHLFEFCDQPWLQGVWREAWLDCLNFLFRVTGVYRAAHRPFSRWARAAGQDAVLDLGSGGAGHIATMLQSARAAGSALPRITVSDLHPDRDAFQRLKAEHGQAVDALAHPVDAADLPMQGCRLRSFFAGFHHYPPDVAQHILCRAGADADGLFILEVFRRSLLAPLLSPLCLPLLLLAPFFSRRFSLKKFLITTVLPLVPLMVVWDGIVSALRTYRDEEILELLPAAMRTGWRWESGSLKGWGFLTFPYFFGYRTGNPTVGTPSTPQRTHQPWEVARYGRLLAGLGSLACTALGFLHHPYWMAGTALIAAQLVVTALTDCCPLRDALLRLGCKEREDLFLPGGHARP